MNYKVIFFWGICFAVSMATFSCVSIGGNETGTVSLDEAIRASAEQLDSDLVGRKVAVVAFGSGSEALSDYVIDELSRVLVNSRAVTVVDRKDLDKVREELQFNLSGEVSDESAQSIGKMLGAQTVITGTLTDLRNAYRFGVKAINVESAAVESMPGFDVGKRDGQVAHLAGQGNAAVRTQAATNTEKVYKIGDEGPAGGIIFYDKGNRIGGWRYLEAAPRELPGGGSWGPSTFVVGLSSAIGSGKENTRLIVEAARRAGEQNTAAQRCAAYNLGGYTDWFLPSRDELDMLYKNLQVKGLGSYDDGYGYFSSTQTVDDEAYAQNFERDGPYAGNIGSWIKPFAINVCPIRAF
jgi:hypothetical protein